MFFVWRAWKRKRERGRKEIMKDRQSRELEDRAEAVRYGIAKALGVKRESIRTVAILTEPFVCLSVAQAEMLLELTREPF